VSGPYAALASRRALRQRYRKSTLTNDNLALMMSLNASGSMYLLFLEGGRASLHCLGLAVRRVGDFGGASAGFVRFIPHPVHLR